MRTHRASVAAAIETAVTTAYPDPVTRPRVGAYPGPTDPPQHPTILVGSAGIDPPSVACPAPVYRCAVVVVVPIVTPGASDDELDDLVAVVLSGLDAGGIVWTGATRGVWADQYPSYSIDTEGT